MEAIKRHRGAASNENKISHRSWERGWLELIICQSSKVRPCAVERLAESSLIGVWFWVAKLNRASWYKSNLMKRPIYAALDLHSRRSVLGSMDHDGQTQPRMRFPTEANILRAQVERLLQRRRPLYLTMEAGAVNRRDSAIV